MSTASLRKIIYLELEQAGYVVSGSSLRQLMRDFLGPKQRLEHLTLRRSMQFPPQETRVHNFIDHFSWLIYVQ